MPLGNRLGLTIEGINRVIYNGNCIEVMQRLIDEGVKVQSCVTSPPYWGLRDYGCKGQLGLEETPDAYVANMVEVFSLVWELLSDDGTLWLNLGDSYAAGRGGTAMPAETLAGGTNGKGDDTAHRGRIQVPDSKNPNAPIMAYQPHRNAGAIGLKHKDMVGIPWRVAFALQAAGWYLRSDIIWSKPNPMPESVTDRPTKAHEYIFLMSKSERYYYNHEAIKEPAIYHDITGMDDTGYKDAKKFNGKHSDKQRGHSRRHAGFNERWDKMEKSEQCSGMRNKRTVWEIATKPYAEAHFATFPPKLIEPCILAGSRPGDIVLDPFSGSGTTGMVSYQHGREYIGIELNPAYIELSDKRTTNVQVDMLTSFNQQV